MYLEAREQEVAPKFMLVTFKVLGAPPTLILSIWSYSGFGGVVLLNLVSLIADKALIWHSALEVLELSR